MAPRTTASTAICCWLPATLAHAVQDDGRVAAAGTVFRALHTPGHAQHHVVWLLEHGDERHVFLGDLAGIVVPGSAFIAVPTPPPEFDPPARQASLLRVIDARPTHLWLTHGGLVATGAESSYGTTAYSGLVGRAPATPEKRIPIKSRRARSCWGSIGCRTRRSPR